MFTFLRLRRRTPRPAVAIDEYYAPPHSRAEPAPLSPLEQMYAYFSPR